MRSLSGMAWIPIKIPVRYVESDGFYSTCHTSVSPTPPPLTRPAPFTPLPASPPPPHFILPPYPAVGYYTADAEIKDQTWWEPREVKGFLLVGRTIAFACCTC